MFLNVSVRHCEQKKKSLGEALHSNVSFDGLKVILKEVAATRKQSASSTSVDTSAKE